MPHSTYASARRDRHLARDFFVVVVGGRRAIVHPAQPLRGTGRLQHGGHQRGFPRPPVSNHGDITDVCPFVNFHGMTPLSRSRGDSRPRLSSRAKLGSFKICGSSLRRAHKEQTRGQSIGQRRAACPKPKDANTGEIRGTTQPPVFLSEGTASRMRSSPAVEGSLVCVYSDGRAEAFLPARKAAGRTP